MKELFKLFQPSTPEPKTDLQIVMSTILKINLFWLGCLFLCSLLAVIGSVAIVALPFLFIYKLVEFLLNKPSEIEPEEAEKESKAEFSSVNDWAKDYKNPFMPKELVSKHG